MRTILSAMRVGDHDAVEYIRHGNAQSKVWREIAGLPRPRVLAQQSADAKAKPKRVTVTEDVGEKQVTASIATRTPRRAFLSA